MRNGWSFNWTPAAIDRLTELWEGGNSGGAIAALMGGGLTRSAILGKIHRLGLARKYQRPGQQGRRRMAAQPKPAQNSAIFEQPAEQPARVPEIPQMRRNKRPTVTKPVTPPSPPPKYGKLHLLDLQHGQCRWPSDGDGPWTFCGRPKVGESSYCPEHFERSRGGTPKVPERLARLA